MRDNRPEMRSRLGDAFARRTRHPALEDTLFHRLRELEQGPLEQLGELVHLVIDELRVAQRRLAEQAGDLRTLQRTVATLTDRLDDLTERVPAQPPVAEAHLLLLSLAAGYRLVERDGPPPPDGSELEHDGRAFRVLGRSRSPLPDDRRPCVLALETSLKES